MLSGQTNDDQIDQKNCDILIEHAAYLNEEMEIVRDCEIVISEGKISAILTDDTTGAPVAAVRIDGRGLLWMPGLVDGHTHTSQQLLRGRLLDEKPVIWKRINVPFESRLTPELSTLSAELAALEMIKNGTTGFVDAGGKYVPQFADVYRRSGLRGALTYMTNDNPNAPDALRVTRRDGVARLVELHETLRAEEGLLQGYFSLTTPTVCSRELLHDVMGEAKARGIPAEIHMNEYASEVFDFIEKYGVRPFEYLERESLLPDHFVAPHCIFLSQSEIEILARNEIRVVHCPFSNCGKGVPDTPQLLQRGIRVGFGSDGSGHGGTDLFREMRLFRGVMNAVLGVGSADPQVMPAKTILQMATAGGASALTTPGLGVIGEDNPADLIAIGIDAPHLAPTQNLVNTLVESAAGSDVRHAIIGGRLIMEDRKVLTLDEAAIMDKARRVIGESGLFPENAASY